jgi:hypothetical protein
LKWIGSSALTRGATTNAAGDIVEIGSALVEILNKSIRFHHEMHKRRRLSRELATD